MNTNIIKTMLFATLLWLTAINLGAQEIKVRNIAQLTTDISARSAARMDANNKECAIVRVNIPSLKTMDFGNAIVGKAEYKAGEYILYVPEGTKQIPLSVNGYKDSMIDFEQYDMTIEGKNVYRVTLFIDDGKTVAGGKYGSMKITTEPESSYLLLDGVLIYETPLTIKDVPAGKHVISFPNTSGYTLPDQTITINENETFEQHYVLKENTDVFDWEDEVSLVSYIEYSYPSKYKRKTVKGKRGVQDYWGNWVVPSGAFEYVDKGDYRFGDSDVFKVGNYLYDKIKMGLYKPGKGLIVPCEYDNIWFSGTPENIVAVEKDGLWGWIDNNGKTILPCMYDIINFYNNVYIVTYGSAPSDRGQTNSDYGRCIGKGSTTEILDINGKKISTLPYHEYRQLTEDKIVLRNGGRDGYISCYDYNGHPVEYTDDVDERIFGNMIIVNKNDEYGIVDQAGQHIVPCTYRKSSFTNDWIILHNNEEWVAVDKNGHTYNVKKEEDNDGEPKIISQYLRLQKNGKYGLQDIDGNTVLPFEYNQLEQNFEFWGKGIISENTDLYFITAKKDESTTIFDLTLKELLTIEDSENIEINTVKEGMIILKGEDYFTYGFMNLKGEILAGCLFDSRRISDLYCNQPFEDKLVCHGLGLIGIGDRWGFVNKDGEIVIPLIYSIIVPFDDGTVYGMKSDGTWVDLKLEQYDNDR